MKITRSTTLIALALAGVLAVAAPFTILSQVKMLINQADHFGHVYQFQRDAEISDFTITEIDGGTAVSPPSTVLDVGRGGLSFTNGAQDNDSFELQHKVENFLLSSVGRYYFTGKLDVSDDDQVDVILGMCITDTTLLAGMTDGVYLRKDDGDTNIDLVIERNSTEVTSTGIATFDTDEHEYALIIDVYNTTGWGKVTVYIDGAIVHSKETTNLPYDESLTLSASVTDGEAAAITWVVRNLACASPGAQ